MFCSILTLFPGAIKPYLAESMLGIAQSNGKIQVDVLDFRAFATDRHRTVDDRPFGGGPGMVLMPGPIFDAIEDCDRRHGVHHKILLCPRGRRFDQKKARELSTKERLLLLCGRYEGFDERIRALIPFEEISIGDYVLCGGELAALVVLEATARLIPGVLGCADSTASESFGPGTHAVAARDGVAASGGHPRPDGAPQDADAQDATALDVSTDCLDHPQYTRPRVFRGLPVPEILFSGNHQAIARWRQERAAELTARRRALHEQESTERLED